ncbi:MAG: glycosyl transferase [Streptococcaceae bacterium]|jgi:hypothetical protein|nr:glycosyl transferase [Streptococcaceae bacterium]
MKKNKDEKIDFVVTYLDGTDPDWLKEKAKYSHESDDLLGNDEARFRNMDNFEYWFRAVERYAPWVNKIHVVTYGHLPSWLNTAHPKLQIVKHTDYMAQNYLPTFNSNALEINMDKIPDLSERFVNFNDDLFLNAPVSPDDFFKQDLPVLQSMATPILPSEAFNVILFNNILALNELPTDKKKLFQLKNYSLRNGLFVVAANLLMVPIFLYMKKFLGYRPDHLAQPFTKKIVRELRELAPQYFEAISESRFRDLDLPNIWFVLDYMRATGQFVPHNSFKFGQLIQMAPKTNYTKLFASRLKILCINDGSSQTLPDFKGEKERLNHALQEKFPQKSEFEK